MTRYASISSANRTERIAAGRAPTLPQKTYEGQHLQFDGYLYRQSFAGAPNYEDFSTDNIETYWMLVLPAAFRFNVESPEDGSILALPSVRVLHLVMDAGLYAAHSSRINSDVRVTGCAYAARTGHHRGDALLEVIALGPVP